MKIGILTYHAACNFGANLQVLSTVSYFINRGYDTYVINYYPDELDKFYYLNTPFEQYKEHQSFNCSNLPLTRICKTIVEVAEVINEEQIDAVIVGSDAVMQHHPLLSRIVFPCKTIIHVSHLTKDRMCPSPFWGSFIPLLNKTIPVCYMSASSQNSSFHQLSKKEKSLLKLHLNRFAYISTRDDWTAKMVHYIMDGDLTPQVTPDPVFAFNYNVKNQFSEEYIRTKFKLKNKYYLVSFHKNSVSKEWLLELKNKSKANGIDCIALPFPQGVEFLHPFDYEIGLPLSPLEWYAIIKYSSGYIGHNMHPIVVSLHNSVPCYSFDNYGIVKWRFFTNEKSSKIYHIMNEFDLLSSRTKDIGFNRIIPNVDEVICCLDRFNKSKNSYYADLYLEKYKAMMKNIEEIINQNL